MKKSLFFISITLLSTLTLLAQNWIGLTKTTPSEPEITLISSNNQQVSFTIDLFGFFSTIITEAGIDFQRLSIPGYGATGTIGEPEMPVIVKHIAVPDCNRIDYSVQITANQILCDYNVYPVPEFQLNKMGFLEEVFTINPFSYQLNSFTPAANYAIGEKKIIQSKMENTEIEPCNPVNNLQINNGSEACVVYLIWEKPINIFVTSSNAPVSYNIYCNDFLIGNTEKFTYKHTVTQYMYNNFCVTAVYDTCESEPLCKQAMTPCTCPVASELSAMQQGNTVLLKWVKAEGNPIIYKIYSGMDEVATVANTEYLFENLLPGEYIFGVEALFEYYCIPVMVTINFTVGEVGVGEDNILDLVLIYPNPTIGELIIENSKWKLENVEIIDIYGKCHLSLVTCHENNIDISHLQMGIYFLRIATEKGVITKKIVKY